MFLPTSLTAITNRFVQNGPENQIPRFRRDTPHVTVGGSILRYSSAGPARMSEAARAMKRVANAS